MTQQRMNRDEFFGKLAKLDDAEVRKTSEASTTNSSTGWRPTRR